MFSSHRYLLPAALVMGLAAAQVHAQPRRNIFPPGYPYRPALRTGSGVNLNPQIAPGLSLQQAAYNTGVLGNAFSQVPPYALGYNPYAGGYATGPALIGSPVISPYALSTTGGYNPYMGTGSLGTSPYSLSTTGGSSGYTPYYGAGGYLGQDPFGAQLQGYASLTAATGKQYYDLQRASLLREEVRQKHLETLKRTMEYRQWAENMRLKPHQLLEREMALELNKARGDAPEVDVSSGRALNTLLASIQKSPKLNLGPNVPLDADTLQHINLTSAGTVGNVGMLKDISKLAWPQALTDSHYDEARKRLNRNLILAVSSVKDGDPVPENTLKDIRADFKTITDKFNDTADELTPADYYAGRRFINQLSQAVRALGDKNVGRFFTKNWTPKGKNVAELVSQLSKEGLTFAAATPGDEPSYKALYLAMREFEAGLASAQAAK